MAAADEIILYDIAHLRPWILMRLHYHGITFSLIKMGESNARCIYLRPCAPSAVDTYGEAHQSSRAHTHSDTHTNTRNKHVYLENTENEWMNPLLLSHV